jgi:hypothetical protein
MCFIEHGTRWMHLGGGTGHPAGEWTVQRACNLALSPGDRFEDIKFLPRRPRAELHTLVRRRPPGRRHQDPAHRGPGSADERHLRTPGRRPAP